MLVSLHIYLLICLPISISELPSNGLRLMQSIEGRRLMVAGDTKGVDAWGMFSSGDDLLLADNDNRAVKRLRGFVADPMQLDVTLMFRDSSAWLASAGWHVSNAREMKDAKGEMLVLTAGLAGGDRRLYVARKKAPGKYSISLTFQMDPSYVCTNLNGLPSFQCLILQFVCLPQCIPSPKMVATRVGNSALRHSKRAGKSNLDFSTNESDCCLSSFGYIVCWTFRGVG